MVTLSTDPAQAPPSGQFSLHVTADGLWYWDGYGWRPTASNPWAPTPAAPAVVHVTADGLWYWDGYTWRPTVAALASWESERRRRIQSWLNLGAAALLFLR